MASNTDVGELCRRYGPQIFARCRRLLGDRELAEDAVQEVFVRAQRYRETLPEEPEVRKWLYRVTRNYCLNVLRDRRSTEMHLQLLANGWSMIQQEELLLNRDLVRRIVVRLPERMQAIVMAYYVEGMDQQQVATALGLSRRTVVNQLQAFRVRSQKYLGRIEAASA